jgi:RNA recognition motif-containing protein
MNRKLFVGNIPFQTSEDDLQNLFGQAGPVESVRVMRDNATGRARGFAFVEMQTEDGASAAIERFNQYQLGGRTLAVNEARPMTPRPGGGGRFEGGGGGGRDRGRGRSEPRW